MMSTTHDEETQVLEKARIALFQFIRVFHKPLAVASLAEVYIAIELGLHFPKGINTPGYDALSDSGDRYQLKYRVPTSVIDVNNFDFDYLVLVNLNDDYQVNGVWRASLAQIQQSFVAREKFRRYQINQNTFKKIAERIR